MSIALNLKAIQEKLPPEVSLCVVSKTHPIEKIMEAFRAGQRIFGENKVQELIAKAQQMPEEIEWHLIGHLQSNKVKQAVKHASMIQSVDSLQLLLEIENEARKMKKKLDVLFEIHIAEEESKFGFTEQACIEVIESDEFKALKYSTLRGLMGIATFTDDSEQLRREFQQLTDFFHQLKTNQLNDNPYFDILSMGMSDDFELAIAQGSNLVRIGNAIFGTRIGNNPPEN
jgi:pyridoxal phosphate enzyme (YggS family)